MVCGVDLPSPHVTQASCFDALHARPRNVQNYHLFCEPLYTKPEENKVKEELKILVTVEISERCLDFQFALLTCTMVGAQVQFISTSARRSRLRLAPPLCKCFGLQVVKLPANGRNSSQHCWSCCVRVGSGAESDVTKKEK